MALKRGIEAAVDAAVDSIAIQAKDVDDKVDIEHVASVSAGDHAIGGRSPRPWTRWASTESSQSRCPRRLAWRSSRGDNAVR
jgi:hypothetical protein